MRARPPLPRRSASPMWSPRAAPSPSAPTSTSAPRRDARRRTWWRGGPGRAPKAAVVECALGFAHVRYDDAVRTPGTRTCGSQARGGLCQPTTSSRFSLRAIFFFWGTVDGSARNALRASALGRPHSSFAAAGFFSPNADLGIFSIEVHEKPGNLLGCDLGNAPHDFQTECLWKTGPRFRPENPENHGRRRRHLRKLARVPTAAVAPQNVTRNDKASRPVRPAITFPHPTPSPDTQLPAVVTDWYVETPRARSRGFSDAAPAAVRARPERCRDSASATRRQTRCRLEDAPRAAPRRRFPGRNVLFGASERIICDVGIDPHRASARNRAA